jgi:hypothetical protein
MVTFLIIGIPGVIIFDPVYAEEMSSGGSNLFVPPIDPDNLPASAGYTSFSTSSSFTSSPLNTPDETKSESLKPITENRITLKENQSATHKIIFEEEGVLTVQTLTGNGFEIFSKEGETFPTNVTFRTDYGKSSLVTEMNPLVMNVTPGTWFFTLFPIGDEGSYNLKAEQISRISPTSGSGGGSFSSSMGATSISFS